MGRYAKAVIGSLVAGLAVLEISLADDFVSGVEWVRVAAATVTALGAVWAVQNDAPKE